jgi:hypothetical protein
VQVDESTQVQAAQDIPRLAHVAGHDCHEGLGSQHRASVRQDDRVDVDVGDSGAGVCRTGDVVDGRERG